MVCHESSIILVAQAFRPFSPSEAVSLAHGHRAVGATPMGLTWVGMRPISRKRPTFCVWPGGHHTQRVPGAAPTTPAVGNTYPCQPLMGPRLRWIAQNPG